MNTTTKNNHPIAQKRIVYFDYLRIAAIFIVILLHTASQNYSTANVDSLEWNIFNIYDGIARWGVPIFVMISGALFLGKEHPIRKIYKKNILRMVIILLFWSTFYAIISIITHKIQTPEDFIFNIIKGPVHLWFLYMITGLYIVAPFLQKIANDKKLAKYFTILALIFAFLIPELIKVIGIWSPSFANLLDGVINTMDLNLVLGFSGYFMLGYLLNNAKITKKLEIVSYILGACSLVFSIISTALLSNYLQKPDILFYNNLTINVLFVSISIFIFFKKHLNRQLKIKNEQRLIFLSKCTLGVYLVHMFFLGILEAIFHINTLSFNPIASVPIITIIVFLLSYIASVVFNKIPFIKDWLV